LFSKDIASSLLLYVILSNALALFILAKMVFRITKNNIAVIIAMLLYATSAWPANYYFMASYTVFATALHLLSFLFIIEAYLDYKRKKRFLILAGLISGLSFLSSPSSSAMIFIQALIILYLFSESTLSEQFSLFLLFCSFLVLIIAPYIIVNGQSILEHLNNNIKTPHYIDALDKLGYIPKPPFFSFFHIGMVYAPVMFGVFILLCILFLTSKGRKGPNKLPSSKLRGINSLINRNAASWGELTSRPARGGIEKILFSLILIIYFHTIIIDLLPFTKLARTHFPAYPLLVIAFVALIDYLFKKYSTTFPKFKVSFHIFCFIIVMSIIWAGVGFCSEMRYSKQFSAEYLNRLSLDTELYMLDRDVHRDYIKAWLGRDVVGIGNIDDIYKNRGKKVALIIGPHGALSGRSILKHSTLDDFSLENMDIYKPEGAIEIKLPYYAYFPSFMLEEEISQALYLSGDIPYYKSDNMKITVWIWKT
jgi:hypothetical protein